MPIPVICPNGHRLTVKEEHAGRKVRCPKCQMTFEVPSGQVSAPLETYGLQTSQTTLADEQPQRPVSVRKPRLNSAARKTSAKRPMSTGYRLKPIAAAGALVLLLAVAGWMLTRGPSSAETLAGSPQVATSEQSRRPQVGSNASTPEIEASPTGDDQNLADQRAANAAPVAAESQPPQPDAAQPEAPAAPREPWKLVPFRMNKPLLGYKLPGNTWAAAYDEPTGRLAVTNDEAGIVIYRIDDILSGRFAPEKTLPTTGLPTAVFCKILVDRRVFVFAGKDDPQVALVDADSLEPLGEIPLQNLAHVELLDGSTNN